MMAEGRIEQGTIERQRLRHFIGRRIREERQQRGWSQEVLADLAELHRSYVGAVERGEHNVGIDNIEQLALALEIKIWRLFTFDTR